jgi:hypothetical protein
VLEGDGRTDPRAERDYIVCAKGKQKGLRDVVVWVFDRVGEAEFV